MIKKKKSVHECTKYLLQLEVKRPLNTNCQQGFGSKLPRIETNKKIIIRTPTISTDCDMNHYIWPPSSTAWHLKKKSAS